MLASLKNKEKYSRYFGSLKYALYVITHPLDGFWDLTHEKRGSIAAANTIVILTVLARIMSLQFTSFLFMQVYWEDVNIFLYIASILFPLALFCVGNWGLTTLFDGKGRLSQIYMGDYEKSGETWREVMNMNGNYDQAYIGIGRALMRQGEYKEAMKYFRLKWDDDNYSKAFKQYRKDWVEEHIGWIFLAVFLLFILPMIVGRVKKVKFQIDTAEIFKS